MGRITLAATNRLALEDVPPSMYKLRLILLPLLLLVVLASTNGNLLRFSLAQQDANDGIEALPPVQTTITRQLLTQAVHGYELDLEANEYLEVSVTKGDLRVAATVFGPQNQPVAQFSSTRFEPLTICFIAQTRGKYRVELRSLEKGGRERVYYLEVLAHRPADGPDGRIVAARNLLTEAGDLRSEWKDAASRLSLRKLSEALALWQTIGDSEEAAKTLLLLGDTHLSLSEYKQAERFYLQASNMPAVADTNIRFRALARAGSVNVYLSQNQKALNDAELALNYYAQVRSKPSSAEEQRDEAEALNTAGEANYSMGRLNRATNLFTRALQLWRSAGDRAGEAVANLNLAYCFSDLGDLPKAQECLNAASMLSRTINDRRGEALALTAYGTIQSFWGQKQAALDKHVEAMNILQVIGNHAGEAVALNSIGKAYEDLNEPRIALDKYHRALDIYKELGNTEFEAVTRYYIGRVHKTLGENGEALKYFQECLQLGRQIEHPRLIVYSLTAISALRHVGGKTQEALQGLRNVLNIYRDARDRRGQANALTEIGRIYDSKRETATALDYYQQALVLTRAAGDRNAEAATVYQIALAQRNLGALDLALEQIEESKRLIESLRIQIVNPDLRASYFASVEKHSALHIDLLMKLDKSHPEERFAERAFEINDSVRARALLEIISESSAKIRQGIDPALLARERALQEQLTARASYRVRALNADDKDESEVAERELRELTTTYQELQTQIRQQSPQYVNLVNPEPLTLKQIQAEIRDPNTILLEYMLGDEKSYVWAVSADSFAYFELPARSRIEALAVAAAKNLTVRQVLAESGAKDYSERSAASDNNYWKEAATLSDVVLGPVAHLIAGKRLLVIAEGKLQYVPFDALPVPGESATDTPAERVPLVLSNEIVILPSASLLTAIRVGKPADDVGKLVFVFADPVFEASDPRVHAPTETTTVRASLATSSNTVSRAAQHDAMRDAIAPGAAGIPRLLATRQEAEQIMAVTPSGEGRVAMDFHAGRGITTGGEIGQYQIVHFATHGVVNTEHPELSGIMLSLVDSKGQSEDGFLQLHDIYNLDLSRTQLVVLSACRTALGKEVKGEGLMGLTRGFMYAGSKSVVATLWKVDDRATAELMKHFYHAMFDEGLPPSTALRKAKEAMWQQPRWRAPYFWAAFVIQGEYRNAIVVKRKSHAWTYSMIVVGVFTLLAAGRYATRSRRHRSR